MIEEQPVVGTQGQGKSNGRNYTKRALVVTVVSVVLHVVMAVLAFGIALGGGLPKVLSTVLVVGLISLPIAGIIFSIFGWRQRGDGLLHFALILVNCTLLLPLLSVVSDYLRTPDYLR